MKEYIFEMTEGIKITISAHTFDLAFKMLTHITKDPLMFTCVNKTT